MLPQTFLLLLLIAAALSVSESLRLSLRMSSKPATAVFSMGCFWAPEQSLRKIDGVTDVVSGYCGGKNNNPTYKSVCAGDGHLEAVLVRYDADKISYEKLLQIYFEYWASQSSVPREGQYSPRIWYKTESELELAQRLAPRDSPVIARAEAATPFFAAEAYHQDFENKQLPRRLALLVAIVLDVIPNVDQNFSKVGALLTVGYIAITIGERVFGSKVQLVSE